MCEEVFPLLWSRVLGHAFMHVTIYDEKPGFFKVKPENANERFFTQGQCSPHLSDVTGVDWRFLYCQRLL